MDTTEPPYRVDMVDPRKYRDSIQAIWTSVGAENPIESNKLESFYLANPAGQPKAFLLWSSTANRHVGMLLTAPRIFRSGADKLTGMLFTDLFVENEHRTLGPSLLLQREAKTRVLADHDLAYGFMNPMGAAVGKRAGYTMRGNAVELAFPTSPAYYIRKKMPGLAGELLASLASPLASVGLRTLALRAKRDYQLSWPTDGLRIQDSLSGRVHGIRSPDFIQWRLINYPQPPCKLVALSDSNGKTVAYLGFRADEGRVTVCDAFASDKHAFKSLLWLFLSEMARRGAVLTCFTVLDESDEYQWLRQMKFQVTNSSPVFCDWADKHQGGLSKRQLYLTRADNDT